MTKKELQNIIEEGWGLRRELLKARKTKHNEYVKEWKLRQKAVKAGILAEEPRHTYTIEKSSHLGLDIFSLDSKAINKNYPPPPRLGPQEPPSKKR